MKCLSRTKEYVINTTLYGCSLAAGAAILFSGSSFLFSMGLIGFNSSFESLGIENKFYKIEPENEANIYLLKTISMTSFVACAVILMTLEVRQFCIDYFNADMEEQFPWGNEDKQNESPAPQQPQINFSTYLTAPGISASEGCSGLNSNPMFLNQIGGHNQRNLRLLCNTLSARAES